MIIWTLFEIYECYALYFIWIYNSNMLLNVYFYFSVNNCGYTWIFINIKKWCRYLHNRYSHKYEYGSIRLIFIPWVWQGRSRILPSRYILL